MDINKILTADFLDILFEGRNKAYGAYELRKTYDKRLRNGLIGMILVTVTLSVGAILSNSIKSDKVEVIAVDLSLENVTEDKKPEPPELEWCNLPESHVFVSKRIQYTNYLQAMEGGIDTSHVSFVHRYEVDNDPMHKGVKALDYIKADGNVVFEIEKNNFGLTLFGRRNGDTDSYYWRITQWLFPWFTLIPPFGHHALGGHIWVPIDDHSCWAWNMNWQPNQPLSNEEREAMEAGLGIHVEYEAPGSFVPKSNFKNDYLMDRQAQKEKRAYSGVFGFSAQDYSLQESMGSIQNHAEEKLLPTDKAIVMARRMLHEAAVGLEKGVEPPALDAKEQRVRAAGVLLKRDIDPVAWAQENLSDGLNQPLFSI